MSATHNYNLRSKSAAAAAAPPTHNYNLRSRKNKEPETEKIIDKPVTIQKYVLDPKNKITLEMPSNSTVLCERTYDTYDDIDELLEIRIIFARKKAAEKADIDSDYTLSDSDDDYEEVQAEEVESSDSMPDLVSISSDDEEERPVSVEKPPEKPAFEPIVPKKSLYMNILDVFCFIAIAIIRIILVVYLIVLISLIWF